MTTPQSSGSNTPAFGTAPAPPDRSWLTPATILGVVGVLIAAATLFYTRNAANIADEEGKRGEKLRLAALSAYIAPGIPAVEKTSAGGAGQTVDATGPHIDITLQNRASGPSLVTKVVLTFKESGELTGCHAPGGAAQVSPQYDFPVPTPLPPAPFTLEKDRLNFQVRPTDIERLTLTLGPATILPTPWYALVDVVLVHDGGKELKVGELAVVDAGADDSFRPDGESWLLGSPDEQACVRSNASLVERLRAVPGAVASKELTSLASALGNRSPAVASGPARSPAAPTPAPTLAPTPTPIPTPTVIPTPVPVPSSTGAGRYPPGTIPAGAGGCSPDTAGQICKVGKQGGAPYRDSPTGTAGDDVVPQGQQHFRCQRQGDPVTYGKYHNDWWAQLYTPGETGAQRWVNAVYIAGGGNDEPLPGLVVC